MLTVQHAVDQLKEAGVTGNAEVFRRWLREGKVPGAIIQSKKQGWRIPEESIQEIIATYEKKRSEKSEYNQGFKAGYAATKAEYKLKMREIVQKGGYEERFPLYRTDFRELAPLKRKDFLAFADEEIFKWGVKNPRQTTDVEYLDGWFAFEKGLVVLFAGDYDLEPNLTLESQAIEILGEYLRKKFIATNKENSHNKHMED